jgi:hypothetical protein
MTVFERSLVEIRMALFSKRTLSAVSTGVADSDAAADLAEVVLASNTI